jgi:hypothetical protein
LAEKFRTPVKSFRKCPAFKRIQGNAFEIEARGSYEQRQ